VKASKAKDITERFYKDVENIDNSPDVLASVANAASSGRYYVDVREGRMTGKTLDILRGLGYSIKAQTNYHYRVSWE